MNSPPPHSIHAAICTSHGYYVWRADTGKPDVFKHHLASIRGDIEHWEKIPTLDDVRDVGARIALKKAWAEHASWKALHA